ncbi:MNIO family bufferin maturase [Gimibacter soli]|uniref:UPF0276 protein PH603_10785 n=1 Tax=Gimibacter soli TaxID=3024400 RepID=A0AAF0BJE3_9PROT|nr:DUF692 domain-containing protein [Gimibacter soli]WCL53024.1 DUF692 domain-containing protein [Gimibacter soli]
MASKGKGTVGISLKAMHYDAVLDTRPAVDFFEIHAENYMMAGGPHRRYLDRIADHYPISLHGVGLSLGSAEGIDAAHLARFRHLVETYAPAFVSEHLAWSVAGGNYLADLLPLPLNDETLDVVAGNVMQVQDAIGRPLLVENPSVYLDFTGPSIPEVEFLEALCDRTGCGLLLDVNNIEVSARNLGLSAAGYIDRVNTDRIGEIHLAGHIAREVEGVTILIDDHGSPVSEAVWALYRRLIERAGPKPTLLERDNEIPPLAELVAESEKARAILVERYTVDA